MVTCHIADGFDDIGLLTQDKKYRVLSERVSHDEEIGEYTELQIVADNGETRWFESYRFE